MKDAAGPGIEAVEAYWDARPCNIRHSPKPWGSREYFDEVALSTANTLSNITFRASPSSIDGTASACWKVGCGIRTAAVNFARFGADYTGVELSQASLDLTRQRFDVYGLKGRLVLCNAEQLSEHVEKNTLI